MNPTTNELLVCDFDDDALEAFFIFSVCVAGHNAKSTDACVKRFLTRVEQEVQGITNPTLLKVNPLMQVGLLGIEKDQAYIARLMKECGVGCYTARAKTLCVTAAKIIWDGLDLRTCNPEALETIPGIGPKTSRFFILYSRPEATNIAVLDVHTLRFLAQKGYNVPKSAPTGAKYRELELAFIAEAEAAQTPVREFDFSIWSKGANAN